MNRDMNAPNDPTGSQGDASNTNKTIGTEDIAPM
jgi:hypothetical protein